MGRSPFWAVGLHKRMESRRDPSIRHELQVMAYVV